MRRRIAEESGAAHVTLEGMRVSAWLLLLFAIGCFRSHGIDDPEADTGTADAALDAGRDAFVSRPDACMPEPAPDGAFDDSPMACRIPFADGCDGERVFDPICPVCPHVDAEVIDGMPCEVAGLACEYAGAGFCNFWGCDCDDSDGDGRLAWACWWPLC